MFFLIIYSKIPRLHTCSLGILPDDRFEKRGGVLDLPLVGLRGITVTSIIVLGSIYNGILYVAPSFMGIDSKHIVTQDSINISIIYVAPSFMGIDSKQ